ncbi:MAG: EamA family transporter RarD [Pseudomonadota bacterium]
MTAQSFTSRSGFLFALSAFLIWGFMPLFWKLTDHIDPVEVTAHRALWSLPVAGIVLWSIGRTGDILPTLKSFRKLGILFVCSCLISANWGVFIWAVAVERTLETALAYYINPLLTILLGFIFLGDRFSRLQLLAILIAATAVLMLTIVGGEFPFLSIFLAATFGIYGLLRKTVDVGPTQGFLIEILLIFPFVLVYVFWLESSGTGLFFSGGMNWLLLALAGPATATPLILYAFGAKRLRLSTIGLMQFIVPTMLFLISIFVFGEPLQETQLYAFIMIWIALMLYAWSILRNEYNQKSHPLGKRMA